MDQIAIIFLNNQIKGVVISDEFAMRFEGSSTGYTVIFSIEIVIDGVFVTIMLMGYVYFRNELEVKSTSFICSAYSSSLGATLISSFCSFCFKFTFISP